MKGLSEHLRIQTNTGIPWFHRRICFTLKGLNVFNSPISTDSPTVGFVYADTSNGMERLWVNENVNAMNGTIAAQVGVLFKGVIAKDWNDYILAPVDTGRVSVKFDKTWTMQSGNASGIVRERKLWHAMNKNLVYDDDENGDMETPSYFSSDSRAGMGDYYVVDFIQAGTGGTSSDLLQLSSVSTLYWHEK